MPNHNETEKLELLRRIAEALERIADSLKNNTIANITEGGGNGNGPPE